MAIGIDADVSKPESRVGASGRWAVWQDVFWAAASIVLLLLVWQLAAIIADDPRRLPPPFQVIARIAEGGATVARDEGTTTIGTKHPGDAGGHGWGCRRARWCASTGSA